MLVPATLGATSFLEKPVAGGMEHTLSLHVGPLSLCYRLKAVLMISRVGYYRLCMLAHLLACLPLASDQLCSVYYRLKQWSAF